MKQIYSESLDEMVISGFTFEGEHYTWHDDDCLYWSDDTDEELFVDVPAGAVLD